ncbi:TraK family protein [Sphingomonas sp. Leaf230]|uniref:TraK family protein n=1 Tax=Sphingomonas sp. Leaf230 TaxID=1735694 RepID=UPI000B001E5D|nr:TraK family protein [Sphingomonas sp. Leaf230]
MTDTPPKPFVERLRDRAARSKAAAGGRNRAAFLSAKPDVQAALDDGWPVSQIWEALVEEGRIDFSYVWFAKYVRDLIRKPALAVSIADPVQAPPPAASPPPPVQPTAADDAPAPEPRPRPKRFHHPESPDMKDYL